MSMPIVCDQCLVLSQQIAELQATLEATERELIAYKGGHALDGGTLASLWAERDALRTALAAAQEDVRALAGVLRCKKTWHLCGTDTHYKGESCHCDSCKVWERPSVRKIMEET